MPSLPVPSSKIASRTAIWEQFAHARSVRAVARKLDLPSDQVRVVLQSDPARYLGLIEEFCEHQVARWEEKHERIHGIVDTLLSFWEALLAEIRAAAKEGRVTNIRNEEGEQMPVLDAVQFLIMSRMLEQARGIGESAQKLSLAYRTGGRLGGDGNGDGGDPLSAKSLEQMSDQDLAQVFIDADVVLPPYLAKKVEQLVVVDTKNPLPDRGVRQGAEGEEAPHQRKPVRGGERESMKGAKKTRKKPARKSSGRQGQGRRKKDTKANSKGTSSKPSSGGGDPSSAATRDEERLAADPKKPRDGGKPT